MASNHRHISGVLRPTKPIWNTGYVQRFTRDAMLLLANDNSKYQLFDSIEHRMDAIKTLLKNERWAMHGSMYYYDQWFGQQDSLALHRLVPEGLLRAVANKHEAKYHAEAEALANQARVEAEKARVAWEREEAARVNQARIEAEWARALKKREEDVLRMQREQEEEAQRARVEREEKQRIEAEKLQKENERMRRDLLQVRRESGKMQRNFERSFEEWQRADGKRQRETEEVLQKAIKDALAVYQGKATLSDKPHEAIADVSSKPSSRSVKAVAQPQKKTTVLKINSGVLKRASATPETDQPVNLTKRSKTSHPNSKKISAEGQDERTSEDSSPELDAPADDAIATVKREEPKDLSGSPTRANGSLTRHRPYLARQVKVVESTERAERSRPMLARQVKGAQFLSAERSSPPPVARRVKREPSPWL